MTVSASLGLWFLFFLRAFMRARCKRLILLSYIIYSSRVRFSTRFQVRRYSVSRQRGASVNRIKYPQICTLSIHKERECTQFARGFYSMAVALRFVAHPFISPFVRKELSGLRVDSPLIYPLLCVSRGLDLFSKFGDMFADHAIGLYRDHELFSQGDSHCFGIDFANNPGHVFKLAVMIETVIAEAVRADLFAISSQGGTAQNFVLSCGRDTFMNRNGIFFVIRGCHVQAIDKKLGHFSDRHGEVTGFDFAVVQAVSG